MIETKHLRFVLSPADGRYELVDKGAGVSWRSNPFDARFGEATLVRESKPERVRLARCDVRREHDGWTARFPAGASAPGAGLEVTVRPLKDRRTLEFSWSPLPGTTVESVRLLDDALWATDRGSGYVLVPVRLGLRVPADSGKAFGHRFDTYSYEGCHMAMFGVVERGAAALVSWDDPYTALDLRSTVTNLAGVAAGQVLSPSLTLRQSARSFRIHVLGKGDENAIAKAYRAVARDKGWLVTWDRKLKERPEAARLLGASNYKLWSTLDRRMNEDSTREERVTVNWTFDEAAQVAEHLKRELQLDRVLFLMGGWIHRGYDNQHPDILPTAAECGGDTAFAECCRRIRQQGYVLGLHDNYQDIYRDSPSWDETLVMRNQDGSLVKGGHWAGGRAYLTCSRQALELAKRPQNLPAVFRLSGPAAYFIDTTYAAGLMECFDPEHPLTRLDDLRWKQALSDYARDVFGLFGSECGREWAIPHADFFEGLTGVSGTWFHDTGLTGKLGAVVVPLFELVYHDTIAMYGKYGYDIHQAADYVLHHLSMGRPLHYHNVPRHLYWQRPAAEGARFEPLASTVAVPGGEPGRFVRSDNGWAAGLHPYDRFVKNTHEILSPVNELTARLPMTRHEFLTDDHQVRRTVFGEDGKAVVITVNPGDQERRCSTRWGGEVVLPPDGFVAEGPTLAAFCAMRWGGLDYAAPALFVVRSQDGRPLDRSRAVRIFHAFGETRIRLGDQEFEVSREAVVQSGKR